MASIRLECLRKSDKKTTKKEQKEADALAFNDQFEWFVEDLKKNRQRCVLAFWHPFMSSSGYHGHGNSHQKSAGLKYGGLMKRPFSALYSDYATVVFTAHDHNFEQFKKQDTSHNEDSVRGIRTFVVGTGGGKLYNRGKNGEQLGRDQKLAEQSEAFSPLSFGVLRVELFNESYKWRFKPIEGNPEVKLPVDYEQCNARLK